LAPEELAPRRADSARSRAETFSAKDGPDRRGRHPDAELQQLASDPQVAPSGVLPGQPSDELHRLRIEFRPARSAAAVRPLATDELPVPPEERPRVTKKAFQRSLGKMRVTAASSIRSRLRNGGR
jgi:hypothetical protein